MKNSPRTAPAAAPALLLVLLVLLPVPALAYLQPPPGVASEPWLPEPLLPADPDLPPQANHGTSVAIAGGLVAVGAPGEGVVRLYTKNGVAWQEQVQLVPGGAGATGFGHALALDEAEVTLVVGAPQSSRVYVFELVGGAWSQTAVFSVAGTTCLGHAVAIDGDLISIGAPCAADQVHVFERGTGGWASVSVLSGPGPRFGWSVALGTGTIAVGNLGGGTVDVFEHDGTLWSPAATIPSPNGASTSDGFARSLALDGDTLVVGAPASSPTPARSGAAYVFERRGGGWELAGGLAPEDLNPAESTIGNGFGWAVALRDDLLLVGQPGDDVLPGFSPEPLGDDRDAVCPSAPFQATCRYPGAVYLFRQTESGWLQEAKLTAPDGLPAEPPRSLAWGGRTDGFGRAVALDDGLVVVGAPRADLVPGDDAGDFYLFTEGLLEVEA